MAHYALLNNENVVVQVITGIDEDITQFDADGNEVGGSTEAWEAFYENQPWHSGLTCKRTSYNATGGFRKQYAGIGYTYDEVNDVFISPQPYSSWVLDENYDWQPPTPKPANASYENPYRWSEEDLEWVAI
jgi:hypothetical protein